MHFTYDLLKDCFADMARIDNILELGLRLQKNFPLLNQKAFRVSFTYDEIDK